MRRLAASLVTACALLALDPAGVLGSTSNPGRGRDDLATKPAAVRGTGGARVGVDDARDAARTALAERLNQLATWCNEKELFLERDRIWRKVIEIAPEDATARKGLRFARNVDGSWKEPAPREVKNLGKKWLDELSARESAVYAPYVDVLLALAQAPERTVAERDALVSEIRALAPNHAGLHTWLGNVPLGDRWVLPETVTARERRAVIRAEARRLMEPGAPLAAEEPSETEIALDVAWKSVLQGEHVRIVSTASDEETLRIARAVEGAGALLRATLGAEMLYPGAYTIYVVGGAGAKDTFLARFPGLSAEDRARMARLEGTGIPGSNDVVVFGQEAAQRVDAAVRHTIGHLLSKSLGVSHTTAWAWEGIGQYLTRELVGTRLTWFVSEVADPASAGLRGKLMNADTNWIQEAYDLLAAGNAVPLETLLGRGLDALDVAGALTGYALVAYLLEGRPDAALEFVRRSARGEAPAVLCGEVLQRTPAELEARLVQWLSERR